MNDISKFMRYTLPGLAFGIELLIALLISDSKVLLDFLQTTDSKGNIGLIVGAFLASGALGYIFAQVYFGFYWLWDNSIFAIDHRYVLIDYQDKLCIKSSKGNEIKPESLTKRESQVILTQYWLTEMKKRVEIEGIAPLVLSTYDTLHSLGAAFIASILSFISWIYIHFYIIPKSTFTVKEFVIFAGWIFYLILVSINYYRTLKALEGFINSTILKIFDNDYNERESKKIPIIFSMYEDKSEKGSYVV